jgi:hypothetical protein
MDCGLRACYSVLTFGRRLQTFAGWYDRSGV